MKKRLVTSIVIFFVILVTYASASAANGNRTNGDPDRSGGGDSEEFDKKPETAPLNPDFIKYQKNLSPTPQKTNLDGHETGYIPPPVNLHHLSPVIN